MNPQLIISLIETLVISIITDIITVIIIISITFIIATRILTLSVDFFLHYVTASDIATVLFTCLILILWLPMQ